MELTMEVFTPKKLKEKVPPGRQPTHSVEFMVMVARRVVEEGISYREASKLYGVSHGCVYDWIKKYKKKNWGRMAKSKEVSEELQRYRTDTRMNELKHEIAELYLENLMLKKTLQHFQQVKKENSSVITPENLAQLRRGAKS